jgi:tetratricopeptide (TPR) repeat protein
MPAHVVGTRSNNGRPPLALLAAAVALAAATLLGAGVARAGDPAPSDAKARYLSGQSHYNLNEFAEALQDFKEAYRLRPDPAFLFNIAQCERQLGNLEEAIKFYRSYLRNKPDAGNKREIERKIEELKGLIDAKKKVTTGSPQAVMPPSTVDDSTPTHVPEPPPPAPIQTPTPAPAEPPISAPAPAATTPAPAPAPDSTPKHDAPGADLTAHPAEASAGAAKPIYRQWWLWAGAGAVLVGLGILTAVALSGGSSPPASALGTHKVF